MPPTLYSVTTRPNSLVYMGQSRLVRLQTTHFSAKMFLFIAYISN